PPFTLARFQALRAHLDAEARPIFESFVRANSLQQVAETGHRPRLRATAQREDGSILWIEFSMMFDPNELAVPQFQEDLKYDLGGGVFMDQAEGDGLVRYSRGATMYLNRPYRAAIKTLRTDLDGLLAAIGSWRKAEALAGRRLVIQK